MSRFAAVLGSTLLLAGCWPEPDLTAVPALDPARAPFPMPVLLTPTGDEANPLVALFVHERDPSRVDLTFVWRDEDHPVPLLDLGYDALRWVRYRRVADVETSWVRRDPATGRPLALVLPGTFAGAQPWDAPFVRHQEAEVPWKQLQRDLDGRPRLWVSTWNHLFTTTAPERPERGGAVEWVERRDLPLKQGSRQECQALYDRVWLRSLDPDQR